MQKTKVHKPNKVKDFFNKYIPKTSTIIYIFVMWVVIILNPSLADQTFTIFATGMFLKFK